MPTVEGYGQQRVGTDAIAGTKKSATLTPDAAGGQFGETLARLGSAALGEVHKRQLAEQQRANELAELSAERQFNQLDTVYLHSADRGALNKGGREPMDLREQYTTEWDATAGEILKAAKSPEQEVALTRMRDRRRASFVDRYDSHATNQFGQYEVAEVNAGLESSVQTAINAVHEPEDLRVGIIGEQLATQRRTIERYAERLKLGPEGATALMQKLASATHVGVVQQLLARQEDTAAAEYFAEVSADISPAPRADLKDKIENTTRDAQAFRAANDVWTAGAPDDDDDTSPIEGDKMEAALRAKFKDDPKGFKLAVQYLRDRKQGVDDARRERRSARDSNLWGAVAANKPISVVRAMDDFLLADGPTQQRIVEFYRADADRDESRAATRDARAEAARNRAEKQKEDAQSGEYFRLSAPEELAKMKRGEVQKLLPTLGRTLTGRLLTDWEQYQANESKVRDATIDRELFQESMAGAGYDWIYQTPGSLSPGQRAIAGRLQNAVEQEIATQQGDSSVRRQLTREEKKAAFQRVIDQKVMVDPWYRTPYETPAAALPQNKRGVAYVPLDRVKQQDPASLKDYTNYLRGLPSTTLTFGPPPTDDEIHRRYSERIQRAYARHLLGGTLNEVNGILEGKED